MQLTRVITVIFNAAKPIRRSQLHLHLRNFARGFGDRLLSKRQLAQRAHEGVSGGRKRISFVTNVG